MTKTSQRLATLTILAAGIFLRFYHFLWFDFLHAPFRLGGLFVAFSDQIARNGFRLPNIIPYYSDGGIPFAYPPLGFYVEAIFLRIAPHSQFLIANLLPPLVSALALLGVFLLLCWHFGGDETHILAGTFAYAFLPLAFTNQIEAAGLAESFGSLALVFFFYSVLRFRRLPDWKNVILVGLALAFSILASPGSAIGVAFLSVMLGLETALKERFIVKSIGQMTLAAAVGLIISAPYWATVMVNHGRGIFILSVLGQYGGGEKQGFLEILFQHLMNFTVVQDGSPFLWNLLIFLGLLLLFLRGDFALPLAFLALFSIPRESVWLTALPAALLFSYGFADVVLPLLRPVLDIPKRSKSLGLLLLVIFIASWMAFQSFLLSSALVADQQWKINAQQIKLVDDARMLIPADAKVLVLGNDALHEWAPYLLQREVINTKFGLEWQPAELEMVNQLNQKLENAATWDDVLQAVTDQTGYQSVYILASNKKRLTALSHGSSVPFTLNMETSEIQLGILGIPNK